MEKLLKKYADKLITSNLCEKDGFIFAGLDDEVILYGENEFEGFETVFNGISINSLLFVQPKEPYRSILNYFTEKGVSKIEPTDCETRTFLHDLPVLREYDPYKALEILKTRKCVLIHNKGVITYGSVSPEQCFVTLSSVCFSTFVKFFSDYLTLKRELRIDDRTDSVFRSALKHLHTSPSFENDLKRNIFTKEEDVYSAISEAGKKTVDYGLVDSFFGNVSAFNNNLLYISQTGSSLDELDGYIDACPMDESTCTGLTASSELSAHMRIVSETNTRTILHGHPVFSVILSMDCEKKDCKNMGHCYKSCKTKREIEGVPIVPGEVGTGPFGLCNTVPPALKKNDGVIVYGHGVFTKGERDFNAPFRRILEIENMCREKYLNLAL